MSSTQVYSATYSNVPVFEFVTLEGPIMRRKSDSWINATHILKIAKFPKAKRTRILEKDVQTGTHEKVQGGYGKYQGTYVPLALGADIAREFDVYDRLRPIFEFSYIEGHSQTPPTAPKHSHASASNLTKRQASITGEKKAAKTTSRKSKPNKNVDNAATKKRGRPRRMHTDFVPSIERLDTTPIYVDSFSRPIYPLGRNDMDRDTILATSMNLETKDLQLVETENDDEDDLGDEHISMIDRPSILIKSRVNGDDEKSESHELMSGRELFENSHSCDKLTCDNASTSQSFAPPNLHSMSTYSPMQNVMPNSDYFNNLLAFFLDENRTRSNAVPASLLNPPHPIQSVKIDRPIDNDGNTIFHWACSMANYSMIEFLLNEFHVSPIARNQHGETPLMFMVRFTNSYLLKNMGGILSLLGSRLALTVDNAGKTVLHHIVLSDVDNQTREKSVKYYLEMILAELVPNTDKVDPQIWKFFNCQDTDGNTAFHLASYLMIQPCIKVFIKYHPYIDFTIRNAVSCSAEDYLASHKFVLRVDQTGSENNTVVSSASSKFTSDSNPQNASHECENYLEVTRKALEDHSHNANAITAQLADLGYAVQKELGKFDAEIAKLYKVLHVLGVEKTKLQQLILGHFNLEHLVFNYNQESKIHQKECHAINLAEEAEQDLIIQEEIAHVGNDLCYQVLQHKNEHEKLTHRIRYMTERSTEARLAILMKKSLKNGVVDSDGFSLASQLMVAIIRKKQLQQELYNKQDSYSWEIMPAQSPVASSSLMEKVETNIGERSKEVRLRPVTKRFAKYEKLISVCCGLDVALVAGSIDIIKQSLMQGRPLHARMQDE